MRDRFGERARAFAIALGWGGLNAGVTLLGIFQGVLVPAQTYSGGGGAAPLGNFSLGVPLSTLFGVFQQQLDIGPIFGLPFGKFVFFLETFGIAVCASLIISDFQRSLVSAITSYAVCVLLVGFVLVLPALTGANQFPDVLIQAAVFLTFTILFPVPLFLVFVGAFIGMILSDRFFDMS